MLAYLQWLSNFEHMGKVVLEGYSSGCKISTFLETLVWLRKPPLPVVNFTLSVRYGPH